MRKWRSLSRCERILVLDDGGKEGTKFTDADTLCKTDTPRFCDTPMKSSFAKERSSCRRWRSTATLNTVFARTTVPRFHFSECPPASELIMPNVCRCLAAPESIRTNFPRCPFAPRRIKKMSVGPPECPSGLPTSLSPEGWSYRYDVTRCQPIQSRTQCREGNPALSCVHHPAWTTASAALT